MKTTQGEKTELPTVNVSAPSSGSTKEPDWCDRCRGNGRIHVEWDWSGGVEERITERCPECGGRGWYDEDLDDEA